MHHRPARSALLASVLLASAGYASAQVSLPASFAAPAGAVDLTKPGFLVRVHQQSAARGGDTIALAISQLNGMIDPTTTEVYPNQADTSQPGFTNGIYTETGTINYNQDSTLENPTAGAAGAFTPDKPVPGIPGIELGTDNFVVEAIGFLQLEAGTYTLGVNSDDGFGLLAGVGTHPRDPAGGVLGAAEVARGAADTTFTVTVSQAGFYPIRLIQWEDGGGAEVEFFSVDSAGVKHLVNNASDPDSIKAFRDTVTPATPYVSSLAPSPNQTNVLGAPNIRITLEDGATPVNTGSVKLLVNNVAVNPAVNHADSTTTITFQQPTFLAAGSTNTLRVIYGDSSTPQVLQTNTWSFVVAPYPTLPAGNAIPAAQVDTTKPGFNFRIAQAPVIGVLDNTENRAEALLVGALLDAEGAPYPNAATADADGDFTYEIPTVINFNHESTEIGSFQSTLTGDQARADAAIPGIPGTSGDNATESYTAVITTFVQLPAGVTTFGVNSDDGFRVSSSTNVTDRAGFLVNRLEVGKGASDVLFDVNAPAAGIYPIRILWYQGNGGGNIEFFTLKNGVKTLVNDPDSANSVKAYRATVGLATSPSFGAILPATGSIGLNKNTTVSAGIYDGAGSKVNSSSIEVSRNGTKLTTGVQISNDATAGTTRIVLPPPSGGYEQFSTQTVSIVWADNSASAVKHTNSTTFIIGGGIIRKFYEDVAGGTVAELLNSDKYKSNSPDTVEEVASMDHPDRADNYGSEYLGYVVPDHTDDYTFYLSSDDNSQLFLSTDESPANKKLIAQQVGWNALRDYVGTGNDGGGNPYSNRKSAPMHLEAGKRYFIEALQKEGGGGDSLGVAWTDTTVNTTIADGAPGLSRVQSFTGIDFDTNPQSVTVNKGLPVTFTGHAISGAAGTLTYQWLRNGAVIPDATDTTYSIPATAFPADNNVKISLRVTDGVKTVTSAAATLTVNNDTAAPAIVSAYAQDNHTIVLIFDEPITLETVVAGNFTVGQGITVAGATPYGPNSVKVSTTEALNEGTAYEVTVNGVSDPAGNLTAAVKKNASLKFSPGFVKFERFNDIGSGTTVPDLTGSDKYIADSPDSIAYLPSIDTPQNIAENYGTRVSGFIVPPSSGNYRFFIRSDDSSQVFVSTDESFANLSAEPVAREDGCCNGFLEPADADGTTHDQTTQTPIALVGGKKYAFVALMKEGGGGDFLQVSARKEGDSTPAGSLTPLRGMWIGDYAQPMNSAITITTNLPATIGGVTNGFRADLALGISVTPSNAPVSIQYQVKAPGATSFVDIAGANGLTYRTLPLTNAVGTVYRAVVRTLDNVSVTSAETTLSGESTPGGASLSIAAVTGGQIQITSTVAGTLQSSTTVNTGYTDVSGVSAGTTFTITPSGQHTFYRLRH